MNFKFYTFMLFLIFGCYLVVFAVRCGGGELHTEDDPEDCGAACERLKVLGCDGWDGSPGEDELWGTADDVSCEEVCRGIVDEQGTLHLDCTIMAESCAEVDECFD